MPFCLENFIGGLGNQIFQIATLISFAKKYKTTFSFPLGVTEIYGLTKILVYQEQIFSGFTNHILYKEKNNNLKEIKQEVCQFKDIKIVDGVDLQNNNLIIAGLPMLLSLFYDNIDDIRNIFHSQKNKLNHHLPKNENIKICIGFRTFDEEGHPEWMASVSYYKEALQYILNKLNSSKIELHIFTDRINVSYDIINSILKDIGKQDVKYFEYFGKRDGITDVKSFFLMMDCDHYIICNSTFHYWPAILSQKESIIICPTTINNCFNDWFINNLVPDHWIQI